MDFGDKHIEWHHQSRLYMNRFFGPWPRARMAWHVLQWFFPDHLNGKAHWNPSPGAVLTHWHAWRILHYLPIPLEGHYKKYLRVIYLQSLTSSLFGKSLFFFLRTMQVLIVYVWLVDTRKIESGKWSNEGLGSHCSPHEDSWDKKFINIHHF